MQCHSAWLVCNALRRGMLMHTLQMLSGKGSAAALKFIIVCACILQLSCAAPPSCSSGNTWVGFRVCASGLNVCCTCHASAKCGDASEQVNQGGDSCWVATPLQRQLLPLLPAHQVLVASRALQLFCCFTKAIAWSEYVWCVTLCLQLSLSKSSCFSCPCIHRCNAALAIVHHVQLSGKLPEAGHS